MKKQEGDRGRTTSGGTERKGTRENKGVVVVEEREVMMEEKRERLEEEQEEFIHRRVLTF